MSDYVDLPFRCFCGEIQGHLVSVSGDQTAGTRLVCYCDDCQAFVQRLGTEERVLNAQGGSEGFQTTHSRVRITRGAAQLACMRLTDKGMLRWYASCCRAPIAGMFPSHRMPFLSITGCVLGDPEHREHALGPVRYQLMTKFARGPVQRGAAGYPLSFTLRTLLWLARSALRGAHRPSAFFDTAGKPIATPALPGAMPSP